MDTAAAERAILGTAMRDSRTMPMILEAISEDDYGDPHHAALHRLMSVRYRRGEGIDLVTLPEAIAGAGTAIRFGGLEYVVSMADEGTPAALDHYLRHVTEGSRLRKLRALQAQIGELLSEGAEADAVVSAAAGALQRVAVGSDRKPSTLHGCSMAALERVAAWAEGSDMGRPMPTGLGALDDAIGGGLRHGRFVVIGARPGMGKTALGVQLAMGVVEMAAEQDLSAVIISAEMMAIDIGVRVLSGYTGIDAGRLSAPAELSEQEWEALGVVRSTLERAGHHRILVDDRSSPSLAQIRGVCDRHRAEYGRLDVVLIDYFQILATEPGRLDHVTALNRISTGLLGLAKDLGCCVVLLSQLNRGGAGVRPKMSDLKGSGQLEQDAHTIILPYRPSYDDPDADPSAAELIVAKNREGPTSTVRALWAPNMMRFEDPPPTTSFFD